MIDDIREMLIPDAIHQIVIADLREVLIRELRPSRAGLDNELIDSLITVIEYYLPYPQLDSFRQEVSVKRLYAEEQIRNYPA